MTARTKSTLRTSASLVLAVILASMLALYLSSLSAPRVVGGSVLVEQP